MPSPVIRLYQVLIEEYESQGLAPPFPRGEFEARRELGSHVMRSLLAGLYPGTSLEDFFLKVEGDLGSPPGCG